MPIATVEYLRARLAKAGLLKHPNKAYELNSIKTHGMVNGLHKVTTHFTDWSAAQGQPNKVALTHHIDLDSGTVMKSNHPNFKKLKEDVDDRTTKVDGTEGARSRRNKKRDVLAQKAQVVAEACWKNYKQVGMKKKGNKTVPNCVQEAIASLGGRSLSVQKKIKPLQKGTKSSALDSLRQRQKTALDQLKTRQQQERSQAQINNRRNAQQQRGR